MHSAQVMAQESNNKRIVALEGKVLLMKQRIKDLDDNYEKLMKFMIEKTEYFRKG